MCFLSPQAVVPNSWLRDDVLNTRFLRVTCWHQEKWSTAPVITFSVLLLQHISSGLQKLGLSVWDETLGKRHQEEKITEDGKGLDDHKNNLVQCLKGLSNKNTGLPVKTLDNSLLSVPSTNFFLRFMRRQTPSLHYLWAPCAIQYFMKVTGKATSLFDTKRNKKPKWQTEKSMET